MTIYMYNKPNNVYVINIFCLLDWIFTLQAVLIDLCMSRSWIEPRVMRTLEQMSHSGDLRNILLKYKLICYIKCLIFIKCVIVRSYRKDSKILKEHRTVLNVHLYLSVQNN